MNNNEPPFTAAELGAMFGEQQAQLFAQILILKKLNEQLRIDHAALLKHIADLEAKLTNARMAGGLVAEAERVIDGK